MPSDICVSSEEEVQSIVHSLHNELLNDSQLYSDGSQLMEVAQTIDECAMTEKLMVEQKEEEWTIHDVPINCYTVTIEELSNNEEDNLWKICLKSDVDISYTSIPHPDHNYCKLQVKKRVVIVEKRK